jgi:hypothetical protein
MRLYLWTFGLNWGADFLTRGKPCTEDGIVLRRRRDIMVMFEMLKIIESEEFSMLAVNFLERAIQVFERL